MIEIDALLFRQDVYSVREYLREKMEPERLLWFCVILTALNDAVFGTLGTNYRPARLTKDKIENAKAAMEWFDHEDFISVCSFAGLPHIGLRHICRGIIAQYHNSMKHHGGRTST